MFMTTLVFHILPFRKKCRRLWVGGATRLIVVDAAVTCGAKDALNADRSLSNNLKSLGGCPAVYRYIARVHEKKFTVDKCGKGAGTSLPILEF